MLATGAAILAAAAGLLACSGSREDASSPAALAKGLPRASDGIVARVGSAAIGQDAYDHLFAAEAGNEESPIQAIPVPPRYEACVQQLKALAKKLEFHVHTEAPFRKKCRERYERLHGRTLKRLITEQWVLAAAAEAGLSASRERVSRALSKAREGHFSSDAEYRRYLSATGLTESDLRREAEAALLATELRAEIAGRLGPFPRSRIHAYYVAHPELESVPEARDLEIVRLKSLPAARRVTREIEGGRSFASVARGLVHQPVASVDGLVSRYGSHGVYHEPRLNDAIFAARAKVLTGPLLVLGDYYIFRVARVYPRHQRPFKEVEAGVTETLPRMLREQAESTYAFSVASQWGPKTRCAPGYVVAMCGSTGAAAPVSLEVPGPFDYREPVNRRHPSPPAPSTTTPNRVS